MILVVFFGSTMEKFKDYFKNYIKRKGASNSKKKYL